MFVFSDIFSFEFYTPFFFIYLGAFLAIMVSFTGNIFMSLIYAVLLFVNATIILLTLGFEFLALVNMLVYVGALAVLFLFVIMLLEIPTAELRGYYRGYSVLALISFLACRLFYDISPMSSTFVKNPICSFTPTMESISTIGYAFYIRYADVLILNSLVLTIALFGALVLAHTRS
jgi:NADH:ubiquinone oxidoreductase subunit 6 (subunit J)